MKLLFIGFNYHEYTYAIRDEFVKLGFQTDFYDIQPGRIYLKIARRLNKFLYAKLLRAYHASIIAKYPNNYFDRVVYLQVHQFDLGLLAELRSRQRKARFTLYNWDSLSTHDYRPFISMFDRVLTFDPKDAEQIGVEYLPLFATYKYQNIQGSEPLRNTAYFVGNIVNPERYRAVMAFRDYCQEVNIDFKFYLSTTVHGWCKMLAAGIMPRHVSFRAIADDTLEEMAGQAAMVFDFANHHQSGFTMRVMENLCAGRKVITNNKRAFEAPFYAPDRLLVYSDLNFSNVLDFSEVPLKSSRDDLQTYYIQNFAAKLIEAA